MIDPLKVNEDFIQMHFSQEEQLRNLYRTMRLIRRFEEVVNEIYMQGRIPSTLHLYIGQEAVATGICANLRKDDYVLSTHRPHGHALAKGVSPKAIMAELFGKKTGTCKGKGGSMHVGDIEIGVFPAIAIVGANVPIAAGAAMAAKMQKNGRIAVSFFGEGATNEGAWHEAMNAAAIWNLPMIFVCENNNYAASTNFNLTSKLQRVSERAAAYGIPGFTVDGNDVFAVFASAKESIDRAREGNGPTLIECMTYRQCGHSRSDPRTYRSREEEEEWKKKDPLLRFSEWYSKYCDEGEKQIVHIDQEVEKLLQEAVDYAESSPLPDPTDVYTDVFKE